MRIRSDRLSLVPCDADAIDAAMQDRSRLEDLTGLRTSPSWPQDDLAGALPLMLAALRADPALFGWQVWLVAEEGMIVGDVGPHGLPDGAGCVEIGFSIVPDARGRGIATEATRAMCEHLRRMSNVSRIVARTRPDNAASMRVLEKAGFSSRGTEPDGSLRFEADQ